MASATGPIDDKARSPILMHRQQKASFSTWTKKQQTNKLLAQRWDSHTKIQQWNEKQLAEVNPKQARENSRKHPELAPTNIFTVTWEL